ncbi:hypothetical protein ABW20_dc0103588 [Dactylellina cionopaga]|nr:hypothetical protein ABW20_dc0103588 [Dactylellina cionopaga]
MTQLVNKLAHEAPDGKCYITCGTLPGTLGPLTSNKRPYTTIASHVYNQQVDVLLPDEVCELVQQKLDEHIKPLQYHRIFMGLKEILEKDFYNHYIRQGNILLLSDGRVDVDDVYCLYDGKKSTSVPNKETYEKAGLVGQPAKFGGRKKERWVVEHNLRQPHMVHGRKAFDRLVWSFTNVLKEQKAWLFCDLHQEAIKHLGVGDTAVTGISVPTTLRTTTQTISNPSHPLKLASFTHTIPQKSTSEYDRAVFYDWASSLHEWLALVTLNADRLNATDTIDSLLSLYEPPTDDETSGEVLPTGNISKISWRGFIPAEYISNIFQTLQESVPPNQWFSITVHGFQNAPVSWKKRQHSVVGGGMGGENLYTILRLAAKNEVVGEEGGQADVVMEEAEADAGAKNAIAGLKYIMWEVVGGKDEHS